MTALSVDETDVVTSSLSSNLNGSTGWLFIASKTTMIIEPHQLFEDTVIM